MAKRYTKEEDQFIRDHCDSMTNNEIAQALGRSSASIRKYRHIHQIKCKNQKWFATTKEYRKKLSRASKGRVSHRKQPDGTIKTYKDGSCSIKVNGKWKRLNSYIWKKHYGEIPKGHKVNRKTQHPSTDIKDYELLTDKEWVEMYTGSEEVAKKRKQAIKAAFDNERLRLQYGLKPRLNKKIKPW